MTRKHDAIVIGTGQAGPALAARLAAAGLDTAIIERGRFGGTCVNDGCIPTKTLVASARAAYVARRAAEFGVTVDGPVTVDMRRVKHRKDEVSNRSNASIEKWLKGLDNLTVYEAHARFEGPHTVRAGDHVLEAEKIFINVGGRASVPTFPGIEHADFWTNADILKVDFLPKHLVVVGGSYIGLEFAQMYRRFGSEVTIVEKSRRLVSREDEDVSAAVKEIVESEGVDVQLASECIAFEKAESGVRLGLDCEGEKRQVSGSHVLLAVGRQPNTDDLGADAAGLALDDHGYIEVDEQLRTNVPGVWALGDVNGQGAFTHTAYNDYEIVADNLLDGASRRLSDRVMTYGLFIDPPLGRVGMTEAQARASGRRVLVGKREMTRVGRAVERSETHGFMKALVDADTKEILGAAILGINGDEAIHAITATMYAKQPYTMLTHAVHIHPTVAELIPTMLGKLKPLPAAVEVG